MPPFFMPGVPMKAFQSLADDLQAFVEGHVPLVAAAGIEVQGYDGNTLRIAAPLDKNINDKGTAFGGSLYNLCVVTGWGMTWLTAQELGLKGDIVVAKGEIDYLRPLRGDLLATVHAPDEAARQHFLESYRKRGKAVLSQRIMVPNEHGEDCVHFIGKYAIVAD